MMTHEELQARYAIALLALRQAAQGDTSEAERLVALEVLGGFGPVVNLGGLACDARHDLGTGARYALVEDVDVYPLAYQVGLSLNGVQVPSLITRVEWKPTSLLVNEFRIGVAQQLATHDAVSANLAMRNLRNLRLLPGVHIHTAVTVTEPTPRIEFSIWGVHLAHWT